MQNYLVHQVFTPTSPARVTFVEREKINSKLVSALQTPGKQVVVYGYSGCGKTTLLVNKLHQLYESHITTRCMKGMTFEQIILDAFDQLAPYYVSEKACSISKTIGSHLKADYSFIKAQLDSSKTNQTSTKESRILPPQLTPQALGKFVGKSACCWVIEDFHKIDKSEKSKLSQLMKIFMDLADEFPTLKIIAIGAVDTARQVVEYDDEMRNRVAEIQVPLMGISEIEMIIEKGEKVLNIGISETTKKAIAKYSSGMASVCHHLCLNMCIAGEINETQGIFQTLTEKELEEALSQYIDEASDSLKGTFDKAFRQRKRTKYDNAKLIIESLSHFDETGSTKGELIEYVHKSEPKYPVSNFDYFIKNLQKDDYGAVIRHDPISGRYSFADPIYRVFALAYFQTKKPKKSASGAGTDWSNLVEMLRQDIAKQISSSFQIKFEFKE